jgi:aspartate racemase
LHIGLIGGIGPAATDFYYRGIVEEMKSRRCPLEMTIVHADAPTLVRNFESKNKNEQAEIFLQLAERLANAGAQFLAITSIGGHFCVDQFRERSPLPFIDLIEVMNSHLAEKAYSKVGLLGTDEVMLSRFYGGVTSTEILVPEPPVIAKVHRAYVDMALSARVSSTQRQIVFDAGRQLAELGAETVLLGGTDLFLAFDGASPGYQTLDCARVHINAIATVACG